MASEQNFLKEIEKIKSSDKKVNFDQTVDLIINLKEFDVRREAFNIFIQVPNKVKDNKIAGFFEGDSKIIDSIKKEQFSKYKEKKDIKKLVKEYDFFVANAKLMPAVATSFGRVLGPVGKMPSPQLGILMDVNDKTVKELKEKINSSVKIRTKEASVKMAIGKKDMKDEDLIENIMTVYKTLIKELPRDKENIKNVEIKFTMTKPIKIQIR